MVTNAVHHIVFVGPYLFILVWFYCRTQKGPAYTWFLNFYMFGQADGGTFVSLDQVLVPTHSLGTKGQRDKGTKGHRDKGRQGQRDKGTKGQRDKGTTQEQRNKGTTQEKGTKGQLRKKEQRNIGTKEQRNKETKEQSNKATK